MENTFLLKHQKRKYWPILRTLSRGMFKSERVFDDGYISDRIAIKDSEIHVWFLDIGNYDEYHMKSLFDILTLDEKAKMSHYVHVADQKRFLVGHSMLRILLSRYLAREPDDIILLKFYKKLDDVEKEISVNYSIPFIRIHKSYLVNFQQIRKVGYTEVETKDGRILKISDTYKKDVRARYSKLLWDGDV